MLFQNWNRLLILLGYFRSMNSHLSDDTKLNRIGEILAKGVAIYQLRNKKRVAVNNYEKKEFADPIIEFLVKFGEASPSEIRDSLSISRSTVYRRLKELESSGLVRRVGETKQVKYSLSNILDDDV